MLRVVLGHYLGFIGIMAVAVAGALGAGLLPESVLPYLGLSPLALGLRAAWRLWRERHDQDHDGMTERVGPGALSVAAVTFANGGDNIGVYMPGFTQIQSRRTRYLRRRVPGLVAVWCAAGRLLATRPIVARALARWGHLLLPVVLIGLGLAILIQGGAFGIGAAE